VRVIVTGGAGFIGSHIAEACLRAGDQVLVLDDLSAGKRENVPEAAGFEQVDLRDRDRLLQTVRRFQPDAVSHQAAQASVVVSMRQPLLDASINIIGTINLLDACVEVGARRFVFAGTGGAMYGEVAEGSADEDTPANPMSPYAVSKYSVERLLPIYAREYGVSATSLRYANVYGPRQDPHGEAGVVAIFINRALAGQPLTVFGRSGSGDDGCIRDYVYVEDVALANMAALQGKILLPVMNIGTGRGSSTSRLAELIVQALGSRSPIEPGPPRAGDVGRSVLDASRYRAVFGEPVGLEEGLLRTAAWFRRPSA
jgi:UDP-glucose 4-epimerase